MHHPLYLLFLFRLSPSICIIFFVARFLFLLDWFPFDVRTLIESQLLDYTFSYQSHSTGISLLSLR